MTRIVTSALLAGMLCAAAQAGPAAELLGYDPEAPHVSECATQQSTARLVTVALMRKGPLPERLGSYLSLGGLYGAANASCPKDKALLTLPDSALSDIVWAADTCAAAAEAAWSPVLKARVEDAKVKSHPDIAAGYADGVHAALTPIRAACDPYPAFAKLEVALRDLTSSAKSMRTLRGCLLWRRAANKEYREAQRLGETKGRSAGLEYLNGPAMLATAQSKLVCEAVAKQSGTVDNSAFQVMQMSLFKTAIEALPERPAPR